MIYSIATIAFLMLYAIAQVISFAYFHRVFPQESECSDIPPGSIVLAPGFAHLGEKNGVIIPGDGNIALARQLAECVDRYAMILTQKAISDAMQQEGLLIEGKLLGKVPVQQMHAHQKGHAVRTLAALRLALQKLDPLPTSLVLMAHDKQVERASMDLRTLYSGEVIVWGRNNNPYKQKGVLQPLFWSIREIFLARPVEGLIRMFIDPPNP